MIRKCHNHKPQTSPWHLKEEPNNHYGTPGRQTKQSNKLSLPHQDDCKTRTDIKKRTAQHITIKDSHNGSSNKQSQQQQNHRLRTNSILSHHGLKCILLALDSAVVEVQETFSSHGSLLTNAMYHRGVTVLSK